MRMDDSPVVERHKPPCGGEGQLERFDHPRRPIEWFVRCRECRHIGPTAATADAAMDIWNQEQRVESNPTQ